MYTLKVHFIHRLSQHLVSIMTDTRKRFEFYLSQYGALWKSMIASNEHASFQHKSSSSITCSPSSSSTTSSSCVDLNLSHLLYVEDKLDESQENRGRESSSNEKESSRSDTRSPSSTASSCANIDLSHLLCTDDKSNEKREEKESSSSYVEDTDNESNETEENEFDGSTLEEQFTSKKKCNSPITNSSNKSKDIIILDSSEDEVSGYNDEEEILCSEESEYDCCDDDDEYETDDDEHHHHHDNNHNDKHRDKLKFENHSHGINESYIDNTPKSTTHSKSNSITKPAMSKAAFKKLRETLGKEAFDEFNKVAFNNLLSSVSLAWSKNLRTTSGITRLRRLRKNNTREASIELSIKVIDDIVRLRATLLHEMCHAAAWLIDGVSKPPHGKCFKKWANIAMRHVKNVKVTVYHDYVIAYKYAWACSNPKCNVIIQRHSRSVDLKRHCCGKCKNKLIEIDVPKDKNNVDKESLKPKKKREPSKFNLFVKQNSTFVRKKLSLEHGGEKISQADVLKECSRLWNKKKTASYNPVDFELECGIQSVNNN